MSKPKKPKKAAIYCRISRDMTGKQQGVKRQQEDCELICRMNNYQVYKVYVDNSISAHATAAKRGKERPEYEKMLNDFKRDKFEVIVAWKLDRLTRSVAGLEAMLNELAAQDLCICTTDLGGSEQDLSRADTVMLAQIMASFAQFEASRKGERTRRANKQRAEQGIMRRGTRCFGYDRHNEVIESEAKVIQAIYDAYSKGSSMGAITRAIAGNDDGALPNFPQSDAPSLIFAREQQAKNPGYVISDEVANRKWSLATTQAILRNPKYAGFTYYAPTKKDGKSQSYNSKWRSFIVRDENQEMVKGKWEAIVDEDTWTKCQELRDKNLIREDGTKVEKSGWPKKHIGAGIYRCGICGQPLKSGATGKRDGNKHTYRCDGHVNRMGEKIDEYVCDAIRMRLGRPDVRGLLYAKASNEPQLKEIEKKLSELRARVRTTENDYDEDLIDARRYKTKIQKLNSEIAKLEDERASLVPPSMSKDILAAPDPVEAFDKLTDPAQISRVIDELCTVTVDPHERGKRVTVQSLEKEIHIRAK